MYKTNSLGLALAFIVLYTLSVVDAASPHDEPPCESPIYGPRLQQLKNTMFNGTDAKYQYSISICSAKSNAIVQTERTGKKNSYVVGKSANVSVKAGTNWLMLTYDHGDNYAHHCNKEARRGLVMITCASYTSSTVKILEEYSGGGSGSECYYLFEIISNVVCGDDTKPPPPLSGGSIFVVVVISLVAAFLILGTLAKALLFRARGRDAIPCNNCLTSFFALQADGCDFVCRCKRSLGSSHDWDNHDTEYAPEVFQDNRKPGPDDLLIAP